jgi:hypothetical protein
MFHQPILNAWYNYADEKFNSFVLFPIFFAYAKYQLSSLTFQICWLQKNVIGNEKS